MDNHEIIAIFKSTGIQEQSHAEKALQELQSNDETLNQGVKC